MNCLRRLGYAGEVIIISESNATVGPERGRLRANVKGIHEDKRGAAGARQLFQATKLMLKERGPVFVMAAKR